MADEQSDSLSVSSVVGGPKLRSFDDVDAARQSIFDDTMSAVQKRFPLENSRYRLELGDLQYHSDKPYTLEQQKKALLGGKTLSRRLQGTWRLFDKQANTLVDERPSTVMHVPYLTQRGTFIYRGNEYTVANQMRLRPGVYSRKKENDELEAQFNVKGAPFRVFMDPESGVFYMRVSQSKTPLFPVLRAIGADDRTLRNAWGEELFNVNAKEDDPLAVKKVYGKIAPSSLQKQLAHLDTGSALREVLNKFELDPDVTTSTLGKPFTSVNPEAIIRASQKLMQIRKGEAETDDRDSLAFQTIFGLEDFFRERIERDAGHLGKKALWRATFAQSVKGIPSGILSPQVASVLLKSGLGQPLEEINPLEVYDQLNRVSRLGEGGIASMDAIPAEARSVQPSYLGYVDPVRAPECLRFDTEVFTFDGWKKACELTTKDKLACLINDELSFENPTAINSYNYDGYLYGFNSAIRCEVTPDHRHWCKPQDEECVMRFVTAKELYDKKAPRIYKSTHGAYAGSNEFTKITLPAASSRFITLPAVDINITDWCSLLGWYIAEGSFSKYRVCISQSRSVNKNKCDEIEALLNRLQFKWKYSCHGYYLNDIRLARYFAQFGFCYDKFIPEDLFSAPLSARQALYHSLMSGDGRNYSPNSQQFCQFCTTSRELALDVERLVISLGKSSKITFEPDNRQERYLGCYVVSAHNTSYHGVGLKKKDKDQYYIKQYSGKVYCPTVPGGLIYVRYLDGTPFWTGNSAKVGVDSRISFGTLKGSDGQLYSKMLNVKTNQVDLVPAQSAINSVVAFPGELERANKNNETTVRAMVNGKIEVVPIEEVNYVIPAGNQIFSAVTSMVPSMSSTKADRASMGSRMSLQALALRDAEAPLVQSLHPDGGSFESKIGSYMGAVRASKPGVISSIQNNMIKVKNDDGTTSEYELYHNFPFNRKSFIHSTPMVKAGVRVEPNQLLARSNFTDDKGESALGRNLRVAYFPYEGSTYEDAIVLSESAAKKLTSEHMYQNELDLSDNEDVEVTKRGYRALFAAKYPKKLFDKYDDTGIIKPGQTVEQGDPLILAIQRTRPRGKGADTKLRSPYTDASITWDHHHAGEVTDVFNDGKTIRVAVKSYSPSNVGDKLANRFGNKGVISKIVPDDQMIKDAEGNVIDICVNPFGVISRGNPIQLIETALGKIARKTGKPYLLPAFADHDNMQFAADELKKHGLSDTEEIHDPKRNRKIPKIMVGEQFFMKLHHSAEGKSSGRSVGSYTMDELPARGGSTGSKRVGNLELNALLSHGATDILRDIKTVRGVRNDDYWRAFRLGYPPPSPQVPFVYKKLVAMMKAAGVNVDKKGNYTNIMAMTDKDVKALSRGSISSAETLDFDSMDPLDDGLFDLKKTGGHGGNFWTHYDLAEPLPNPVMEEPIRKLLGLTGNKFEAILSGKEQLFGRTGGEAIHEALKRIDVQRMAEQQREIIRSGSKSKRDEAVKRLGFLSGSIKTGIHPSEWMLQSVPIIPPVFRPISRMGKMQMSANANDLYKELIESDKNWRDHKDRSLPDGDVRLNTYNTFKAVTGLGDPVHPKLQEKQVQGFLAHIFGRGGPKTGYFQHKVLGSAVDVVGRGVITPDPALDMDQIGIPEDKAWEIYRNFVIRNLVKRGAKATDAVKHVVARTAVAKDALMEEVGQRPVIATRAPVLHKFGVMAHWPHITSGDTIKLPPLVTGGYGADFDGDTMNYHVPVSDDAVKEAVEKLLPSKNLLSVSNFDVHMLPPMEYLHGLYMASRGKHSNKPVKYFKTAKDVEAAFKRGEINIDDQVSIMEP